MVPRVYFLVVPVHLECVHHLPNVPLSPLTFLARDSSGVDTDSVTVLQPAAIPAGAGTESSSCSEQSYEGVTVVAVVGRGGGREGGGIGTVAGCGSKHKGLLTSFFLFSLFFLSFLDSASSAVKGRP